ncbi:DUF934 domain-containing protein [Burkholderia sp. Ax-1719]|uniref:DUF934 domain-containing protein n=1 Tax=Burkholderia sp. Ax-1719 TaxID=2608334 RepID=UPI00141F8E3C|nr:DUF934 domain-containing protein [Burkholderia sp. Ax-1719]NIE62584.1 DUF934 domain-containing protein [Burkholderia sp. Ax-1719]
MKKQRIRLVSAHEHAADPEGATLTLANDADPLAHALEIAGAARVELQFPTFTDGRAFSQAWLVRRRLGFKGDLRATGEVLADQLLQMERTGFSSAVLQEGVDRDEAERQLERFACFYQADVLRAAPWSAATVSDD